MAAPLKSTSIVSPAFYGLNTTDSEVTLDPKYARNAENCIIDAGGRVGARKGWQYIAQTDPVSTVNLKGLHRFIDVEGVEYFGAWSDTGFYIKSVSDLNSVTYTGSQTISTGNWQAATLNDAAYLFQRGYAPIYFNPTTGQLDDVTNATNNAQVNISNGGTVTATNSTTVTITHSGTVATVAHTAHGYTTGDSVVISGADQADYNGTFTITVTTTDEYEYTMSNSPSVDATGTITENGPIATVDHTGHLLSTGDSVTVSGATEAAYNGTFTITVVDSDTYTYKMSSTPSTDATGTVDSRSTKAVVTHTGHPFATGQEIVVSGSSPSTYDGTYTITKIDIDRYSYTLSSVATADTTGSDVDWDKGTPPQGNTVLSAYGRLWVADTATNKTTVYWSDLLDGAEWRPTEGTVGELDITSILVNGNDEIVALGAHNGYLYIFCKNNIIVMGDTSNNDKFLDPSNMQLIEVINGIGCIARDSVQNTGTDILFLSESGVRSLGRTIQEKSQPMRDISRNIRNTLIADVYRENKDLIKSAYSEHYGFYLLTVPTEKTVYCFDMKEALENGSARVTRWNNLDHTSWLAFDGDMYMTNAEGIAQYFGYQDNGSAYVMQYYTNYFDFGMQNLIKIAKNVAATVIGSTGQKFVCKVGVNYEDNYSTYNMTVPRGVVYEYNIDEYGFNNSVAAATQGASTVTVENTLPTITAATQANPCQITSVAHGLSTGDEVYIDNVTGMVELNGNKYTITKVDADNFTLDSTDSTAYTTYTSGGDLTHLESYTINFSTTASTTYNVGFNVWLDADTYYYSNDNGSRTKTTIYTPAGDWSAEYSGASLTNNVRIPVGNSGFVIQLGFESTINGGFLNIQQVDLYVKQGRLN